MSLASRINDIARLHGEFTLRSGAVSDTYFDKYRFLADPLLIKEVAIKMTELLPKGTEVLAGLEMGGIPLVTMLSQLTGLPAAFIRKEPKEYGTCRYAEGADLVGKKIVFIEDIVTSGGAILDAASKLRSDKIYVENAICVIDRQTGGKEKLEAQGIQLKSVFTAEDMGN